MTNKVNNNDHTVIICGEDLTGKFQTERLIIPTDGTVITSQYSYRKLGYPEPTNQKRKKRQKQRILIRACSICGHPLVIVLPRSKRIPQKLWYSPMSIYGSGEYWECAQCNCNNLAAEDW